MKDRSFPLGCCSQWAESPSRHHSTGRNCFPKKQCWFLHFPCFLGLTVVGTGMSIPDVTPWQGDIPIVDTVFATASPGRGFVRPGSRQSETKHSTRRGTVLQPALGMGHPLCHPWHGVVLGPI